MKLFRLLFLTALAASAAQTSGPAALDSQATLHYIHAAWDSLTRSATDCAALTDTKVDAKVAAVPILYLPAGFATPAEVSSAAERCHVRVVALPRHILKLGDVHPEELAAPGLLYLPHPYAVPGGRFNEMYGWDSFFILLGLESDHREALAKGIVDNFLFEVEQYGAVLNANRTYYLTRSQPPFLTAMIRLVFEDPASFPATPAGRVLAMDWLDHAYAVAEKDYSTWTRPEHLAGHTGLARYFDYGLGPVPEMADANTYYRDVIRALVEHPSPEGATFLVKGSEHPDAAEAARLKQTSCDVRASLLCARAWYEDSHGDSHGGYRLSRDFFVGDRAMRESGFDSSDRFGPFSGATHHYAPVCLNSLLYRYERDMAHLAHLLGKPQEAHKWDRRATVRAAAIQRYLWQPKEGVFADYDFTRSKSSTYAYLTSLYPLWAGVATRAQANAIEQKLNVFERAGGLSMSTNNSGLQWDEPCGWAPTNWIAVVGLEAMGFHADAVRIARHFDATVDAGFAADGTIREKYNVVVGNAEVTIKGGYTQNVIGFGWTNAVYLKFREIAERQAPLPAEH